MDRNGLRDWEEEWRQFRGEMQRRAERHRDDAPKNEERSRARRAAAAVGFSIHLMGYVGVIGLLALINLFTSPFTPWFLWPAFGWGLGIFSHYMAVLGRSQLEELKRTRRERLVPMLIPEREPVTLARS